MGIFDFFRKKEMVFKRVCPVDGPAHLCGNYDDIPQRLMTLFRIKEMKVFGQGKSSTKKGSRDLELNTSVKSKKK